jgi:hypothetical protein|tara:strand:+ start:881 stop:1045 length:165 start_codon:yes stop_codon:yes gene_type:complete
MDFIVGIARITHWFLIPFLVIWMAIAPDDMLPNCLIEAKQAVSDKFSGGYFGKV